MLQPDPKAAGQPLRTRFAPSPTGYLHLGHVVNAIHVWGLAQLTGAEVILRLEDHDQTRCRPEYETALLQDLEWLGFRPDLGLPDDFRAGPSDYRQTDATSHYQAALHDLQSRNLIYACDCSRKDILARTGQTTGELRYDGHCRNRNLQPGPDTALRIQLPDGPVHFTDGLLGPQTQHPALETGDPTILDRNGNWTYQFAVVVDDLRHGANLIVRGEDILSSTGRQILIARLLTGTAPFHYLHHSLLTDPQGRKLSKRDFAADIHQRMLSGEQAPFLLGEAAWRAGLLDQIRPLQVRDLPHLFGDKLAQWATSLC